MYLLGISAFYHDSAAALLYDGSIVAAAQEERFTRVKHDSAFPANASAYCLKAAGITLNRKMLSEIAIHDPAAFDLIVEKAKAALPEGITLPAQAAA